MKIEKKNNETTHLYCSNDRDLSESEAIVKRILKMDILLYKRFPFIVSHSTASYGILNYLLPPHIPQWATFSVNIDKIHIMRLFANSLQLHCTTIFVSPDGIQESFDVCIRWPLVLCAEIVPSKKVKWIACFTFVIMDLGNSLSLHINWTD